MLTGKPLKIFDLLNSTLGDWVSRRKIITEVWGNSAFQNENEEKKWRKNLNGQISFMKSNLKDQYAFEKSKHLDAIKMVNLTMKSLNEKLTILVAASTPFAGGGMHIAPDALKYENKVNLLYAKKVSRIQAIGLLSKVMSGNHLGHPKVNNFHVKNCVIETNEKNFWAPLVYGDGEHLGNLPVDIKKGQKRLKVLVANNENTN